MKQYRLLINGRASSQEEQTFFDSINPSNGECIANIADASGDQMDQAIDAARTAFDKGTWSSMLPAERGIYLKKIAGLIRKHAKELADIESKDTGKPIKHTTFIDVPMAADCFEYFSNVDGILSEEKNKLAAPVDSTTLHEPVGVVGAIIPWNYPLIFFAWKVAPALVAGNCVILKPSPVACASIMRIAELMNEIGLPDGILNVVVSKGDEISKQLVASDDVNLVSFTGSTAVGKAIMKKASDTTKKIILELGGKSANIVLSDCDLDAAVSGSMSAIFMNQGQMCTAGSRLLVEESIYDEFISQFIEKTQTIKIGQADDHQTTFGPLVSAEHRDNVLSAIERGVQEGATLACGGKVPEGQEFREGAFLEPTILTNATNEMTVAREEIFGPVVCVIKVKNTDDAIKIANDSKYGLAATIWTRDLEKVKIIAKRLECGTVWINTYGGFYNEVAFGGYKQSGFGRELGKEGLLAYTNSKHICIDQTPGGVPLAAAWF